MNSLDQHINTSHARLVRAANTLDELDRVASKAMGVLTCHRTVKCRTRGGFSLIELVIVVVIIGVLGAIAVPRLSRAAEASECNAFASSLNEIVSEIEKYQSLSGDFPDQQPVSSLRRRRVEVPNSP